MVKMHLREQLRSLLHIQIKKQGITDNNMAAVFYKRNNSFKTFICCGYILTVFYGKIKRLGGFLHRLIVTLAPAVVINGSVKQDSDFSLVFSNLRLLFPDIHKEKAGDDQSKNTGSQNGNFFHGCSSIRFRLKLCGKLLHNTSIRPAEPITE